MQLEVDELLKKEVETEFIETMAETKDIPEYVYIKQLVDMKKSGQVSVYYEVLSEVVEKWKQEYKESVR